ncbi:MULTISPECIES: nuclear transport factor 2 family protein [Burkholderiaceae]|uniref:nuclear transport factor 2 family protein n=1 Tax=Burkholderiaceae TaxID=119060 RepID=UPI001423A21B|nr:MULTISPECIES: nuclear transport factor 2 family protein [Burkholderiaceae]MBN3847856.1 nuclear transport factor 2 family protein [Paraburkholderia sp. Ac-20342]NIF52957.1 nuclear transport factor 2 family protein [Burkholderia sp. Ax-1724]NIF76329.1 nuclear transport factor 2 family protein [Paraburkholderia sp. Cy-641]
MSHPNTELIERFYTAFQQRDAETMAACYADDAVFSDPAFGELRGEEVRDMWRMLVKHAQDFSLTFGEIEADDASGRAQWVASYQFTQTGRPVVNRIEARFAFRDGLIVEHRDRFDLWLWMRQAMGVRGALFGWSPLVQRMLRAQARRGLTLYRGHLHR